MKLFSILILFCFFAPVADAQPADELPVSEPVIAQDESAITSEEPVSSEEELKQTQGEISTLLEELKGIDQARSRLEESRNQLRQIVITNNEGTAIKMLQAISAACQAYSAEKSPSSVPFTLKDLEGRIPAALINATEVTHPLYGYYYEYQYGTKSTFTVKAIPAAKDETGIRIFSIDQMGEVINAETQTAISAEAKQ